MLHRGSRSLDGHLPAGLRAAADHVLDEFMYRVAALTGATRIRTAMVRSQLPCNLVRVLDDTSLSVAAEKCLGMPSTLDVCRPGIELSAQAVLEAAKWEYGYDDPFVVQFPATILEMSSAERAATIAAIAEEHVRSEVARVEREMNQVQITPVFGAARYTIDPGLAFVLMPFREDLTNIYASIVKPAVESPKLGLVCRRADDLKTNRAVIQDIWKAICEARVVIADLTGLNPNVMYELGIAHTVGKETVLIYQRQPEIQFPFDLAHIRRIEYANDATGGKKLEVDLVATLHGVLNPRVA